MNCLNETEIQQFIDHELTEERHLEMEEHLKACPVCTDLIAQAEESKSQIFTFLDQYAAFDNPREVPDFRIETGKKSLKKYILISAAAASILLIIGIGIRINNERNRQKQLTNISKAAYDLTRNTDLNKMVRNKQIIVVTTNAAGEVVESSLTGY